MKTLENYLTSIYGISKSRARELSIFIGANPKINYDKLPKNKKNALLKVLAYYKKINNNQAILSSLKKYNREQIPQKIKLNTLQGKRYKLKLPVRGQRTRSNANNAKRH